MWDANGVPVPSSAPLLSKQNVEDLAVAALSLPYVGDPLGLYPEFDGMTNAEVMLVKLARQAADGSMDATEILLDRVLGRPKQSVESKTFRMTYEDLLREKAAAAQRAEVVVVVEGVQIVPHRADADEDPFGGMEGLI